MLEHYSPNFFSTLSLWHLTPGIPVTQCDAHDAECQVKVTAFNSLPCQISFKFWSSAAPTGHLVLASKG